MNSRFPELRENLTQLTTQFVKKVCDVCSQYHYSLAFSKNQLNETILNILKIQKVKNPLQQYGIKLSLQNSLDDAVKKEHKHQELYLHDQFHHSSSGNSDHFAAIFQCQNNSLEQSPKLKKNQRFYQAQHQITVYHDENVEKSQVKVKLQHIAIKSSQKKGTDLKQEIFHSGSDPASSQMAQESNSQSSEQNSQQQKSSLFRQKGTITENATVPTYLSHRKYRSYSQKTKKQAVTKAIEFTVEYSSKFYDIPKKNIIRWMRKKKTEVRGRKPVNTAMEQKLSEWILENIRKKNCLTQHQIRNKAKEFSNNQDFRASKGWLEKYYRRNKRIAIQLCDLRSQKKSKGNSQFYPDIIVKSQQNENFNDYKKKSCQRQQKTINDN